MDAPFLSRHHRPRGGAVHRQLGFTLTEMLTVMLIIAVLAAIVAPSFHELIVGQRVRAAASALRDSLWLARSEAIKRNRPVSFTLTTLQDGWTVTLKDDESTVLRKQDGMPGLHLTYSSGTSATFEYNSYGRLVDGLAAVKLTLSGADDVGPRCISFDAAARPKMTTGQCS